MLHIRNATIDDASVIRDVHEASVRALTSAHYASDVIQARAQNMSAERYLPKIDAGLMIVAVDADGIVGFGSLDLEQAQVVAVYVAPDAVGRGVGSALLARLESIAADAGLATLGLLSSLNAVDFYARRGYDDLGPATHPIPGGIEIACVRMSKRLGSGTQA